MNRYTIYCTESQTKRAYKLGAPIAQVMAPDAYYETHKNKLSMLVECDHENVYIESPTAEQMCGWLREKGLFISVHDNVSSLWFSLVCQLHGRILSQCRMKTSYEEAILAAIDAALDYLEKGGNNGND